MNQWDWVLQTTNYDYAVLRFKDFQGPFTSNSKTFKALLCLQGLSRSWKNDNFFSRTFKDFQGPVATLQKLPKSVDVGWIYSV